MSLLEVLISNEVLVVILIALLLYYYGTNTFDHFEKIGVKCLKPLPYFGNTIKSSLYLRHYAFCYLNAYEKAKGEDFIGFFQNKNPFLIVRNLQIMQKICTTDFNHFQDRGRIIDEKLNPLRAFHLLNLKGQKWKTLRQKLTPSFSSGKLKYMFDDFNNCGDELLNYLEKFSANGKPVDMEKATAKFSFEVIGRCLFGLNFNSIRDPNSTYSQVGDEILKQAEGRLSKALLKIIHPQLPTLLNMSTFSKDYNEFFLKFVKNTIEYRENNNIQRSDLLKSLWDLVTDHQNKIKAIENKNLLQHTNGIVENNTKEVSDNEILFDERVLAANAYVFYVGGYDTTSTTLKNCLFELSLSHNLHVQNRLRKEIVETLTKHNNNITYDAVKEMPYLSCVLSETLRMYPVVCAILRTCNKPYTIPGTTVTLNENDKVLLPINGVHYDPEYYPEPDLFDPERFNEENKKKLPSFCYLPFGSGPRACIGTRFALLEMQVAIAKILSNYELALNTKVQLPLKWNPRTMLFKQKHPILIDIKPIQKDQHE